MIFQPSCSSSESQVARAYLNSSGYKAGAHAGQDTILSQGPLTYPPSLRPGQLRHANYPHMHIFGMGRKTEYQRKSTQTQGECTNATPTMALLGINFFKSHQRYNKVMLKEMRLFKDLVYSDYRDNRTVL